MVTRDDARAPGPPVPSVPPHGDLSVRDLRWNDFDDLRETYYRLYDERAEGEAIGITLFSERPSLEDEAEWFSRLFRDVVSGRTIVSVAEVDGQAVGTCTIGPAGPSSLSEVAHVGVLGILVRRGHRGQGAGTALLTHALGRCPGRFELVRLSVFADNVRAQRLYARFGFAPVGRLPAAIRRGGHYFDEVVMVRDFRAPSTPTANV